MKFFVSIIQEESLSNCSKQIPMSYQIFNIYNCLSLTILNSYALQINFLKDNTSSGMLINEKKDKETSKLNNKNNNFYSDDFKKIRGEMKRKLIIIAKKSRPFMSNTTEIIRECDPKTYIEGQCFFFL